MTQGDEYKHTTEINYLADLVGADLARDQLKVRVEEMDPTLDVTLDGVQDIDLAAQSLATLDTDVGAALSGGSDALDVSATTVPVKSPSALDVSAATVPTEQQTPVGVEDATGTQISPLAAGDQPLDVSGATVTVTEASAVATQPHAATAFENGTALASGGTLSNALSAVGADTLRGRVVRASTSYDVTVDWQDSAGNVLFSDTIASAVTAGTETSLNEPAESPYCTVNVTDAGSASGAVTAQLHLR